VRLVGGSIAMVVLLGCAGGAAPAGPAAPDATGGAGTSILFIGNSLTESNDLAGRVATLSRRTGHPIDTSAVTRSGFSLSDHLQDGRAVRAIRARRWTWVALQQGPSTLPESRAELITSARRFAEEIRQTGAQPALLMAWPLPGQTFQAVSASYRAAAEAVDARVFPAGDALGLVVRRDASLALFTADGFHPSPLGSDVAALAVHCALFPEDRAALPEALLALERSLGAEVRRTLVDAACEAAPR
jgi:lysophospholipase L1-like esterase